MDQVKPIYADGWMGLYQADCLKVLPQFADKSVEATITDPPYEQEAHNLQRRKGGDDKPEPAVLDFAPMTEELRCAVSAHIARVTKGWALVFCQIEAVHLWRAALVDAGARYMRTQVWVKPNPTPQFTGDRPGMGHEAIVTVWCGAGRSTWNGGGLPGVYQYGSVMGNPSEPSGHPTQKPLALMRRLVELFTDPWQIVLDPFCGAGTTLRAARDLGRRGVGIEIDPEYCGVTLERLRQQALPLLET